MVRSPTQPPLRLPVRIAFCITELDDGGAERALVRLVQGLDRNTWDPFVICLASEGPLAAPLRADGIDTVCLDLGGVRDLWRSAKLVTCLRRKRPRLLQTFLHHANLAGRIAAAFAGIDAVVSGIRVAERRSRTRLQLDRWTQRLVDRHVCVSQAVAEFSVRHGLDRKRICVIPNGVDYARFAEAQPADLSNMGIPQTAPVALFVGRLEPQKGPDCWLHAFRLLATEFPDVHTVMAGTGPLREALQTQAAADGLADRVHLLGQRDDIPELMRRADCFVLASRWEGMPNVLLEAMAAGRPCVATSVEGVPELLQAGDRGWIVAPETPAALARAVANVLSNPGDALRVAHNAQSYVKKEVTWSHTIQAYDELYRSLLHLRSRRG